MHLKASPQLRPPHPHPPSAPSCLRAIRELQKNGHIPSDASLFKSYAEYGHFIDVRIAALDALVDYTRGTAFTRLGEYRTPPWDRRPGLSRHRGDAFVL